MTRLLAGLGWALLAVACAGAVLLAEVVPEAPMRQVRRVLDWGVRLVERSGRRVL